MSSLSPLIRVNKVIETGTPETSFDNVYLSLYSMMQNFADFDSVEIDVKDSEQIKIIKTAEILMNKKVYSNSYLEV